MTCPSADTTNQSQGSGSNSSNQQDSSTTGDDVTAAADSLTAGGDVTVAAGSLTAGDDLLCGTTPTNKEDFREITPVAGKYIFFNQS